MMMKKWMARGQTVNEAAGGGAVVQRAGALLIMKWKEELCVERKEKYLKLINVERYVQEVWEGVD